MKAMNCPENEHTFFTTNVGGGILRHNCVNCSLVSIEPISRHDIRPNKNRPARPALRDRVVRMMQREIEELPYPAA